ncbi:MAG: GTP cyclohydrolase I FolE [Sedimentisphaerales bacterium]|nr:GTP cyclohydrolase I FolE [Sedimentisphaerales bacterium]
MSSNQNNNSGIQNNKSGIDTERIEKAVREILIAIGEDPQREGLLKTPNRVARMYGELFGGMNDDPKRHVQQVFTEDYDEIVLLKDIPFYSMCEHHLLPFMGQAHVGYLPRGKVVGISKLARIVASFARRPQVQERLTTQIAEFLMNEIDARGVAVVMEATHTCMTIRGVKKPGSKMVTSAMLGVFRKDARSRGEVMSLLGR